RFSKDVFGLASYWFRELFIGHSLTIRQKLEKAFFSSPSGTEFKPFSVGEKIGYFEEGKVSMFLKQREKQIIHEAYAMEKAITLILDTLQENSCFVVGIDFAEVCSLGDVNEATARFLKKLVLQISKVLEDF
ncbi:MAG: hypothetical protein ACFFBD_22735, partial [Candidatus Hodarchaeota archaeon]